MLQCYLEFRWKEGTFEYRSLFSVHFCVFMQVTDICPASPHTLEKSILKLHLLALDDEIYD